MKIQLEALEKAGYTSATDYCRFLMDEYNYGGGVDYDPRESLEVYRGAVLAYTVSSIEYGATIEPGERGFRKAREIRFKIDSKACPSPVDAFK